MTSEQTNTIVRATSVSRRGERPGAPPNSATRPRWSSPTPAFWNSLTPSIWPSAASVRWSSPTPTHAENPTKIRSGPLSEQMRDQLATEEGQRLYRRREAIIEAPRLRGVWTMGAAGFEPATSRM
jgi:hypothetical protein